MNSSTASPGNGLDESDNARFLGTGVGGDQSFVSIRPVNAHNIPNLNQLSNINIADNERVSCDVFLNGR